ncbi:hypothetical protein AB1Y20_012847 [Prymnesium parvum]|uniref:Uncharacterized protein n=1 Tax=Prymnesium parvum TaxID=97485 RepID=A0AB34IJS0_PRYPA
MEEELEHAAQHLSLEPPRPADEAVGESIALRREGDRRARAAEPRAVRRHLAADAPHGVRRQPRRREGGQPVGESAQQLERRREPRAAAPRALLPLLVASASLLRAAALPLPPHLDDPIAQHRQRGADPLLLLLPLPLAPLRHRAEQLAERVQQVVTQSVCHQLQQPRRRGGEARVEAWRRVVRGGEEAEELEERGRVGGRVEQPREARQRGGERRAERGVGGEVGEGADAQLEEARRVERGRGEDAVEQRDQVVGAHEPAASQRGGGGEGGRGEER